MLGFIALLGTCALSGMGDSVGDLKSRCSEGVLNVGGVCVV
jgi:hypothetical protein